MIEKHDVTVLCIFLKLFLLELLYEFIDSIDLKWCIRHWFTHTVFLKMVLTSDINIIATSSAWRSSTRAARARTCCTPWRTLANLGEPWRTLANDQSLSLSLSLSLRMSLSLNLNLMLQNYLLYLLEPFFITGYVNRCRVQHFKSIESINS
jgi:hypothetical protein